MNELKQKRYCKVPKCENFTGSKVHMFKIPKYENVWKEILNKNGVYDSVGHICIKHFASCDYIGKKRRALKKGAFPTIFDEIKKEDTVDEQNIAAADLPDKDSQLEQFNQQKQIEFVSYMHQTACKKCSHLKQEVKKSRNVICEMKLKHDVEMQQFREMNKKIKLKLNENALAIKTLRDKILYQKRAKEKKELDNKDYFYYYFSKKSTE